MSSSRSNQAANPKAGECRWRLVNGLSAVEATDRAAIDRKTLPGIETGTGTGGALESVFAVLETLGITEAAIEGIGLFRNEVTRVRIDEILFGGGSF